MESKLEKKYISKFAFTLLELVIVLVIVGILLMATLYLSWEQIQKVRDKTVKESILAEMQSRYSRNLWSSSFAWIIYDTMDVTFSGWENRISFTYNSKNKKEDENRENIFTNKFEIKYLKADDTQKDNITITYQPYKINCKIWEEWLDYKSLNLIIRVNDHKDYCFEINNKNCRLFELSESNCESLKLTNSIKD